MNTKAHSSRITHLSWGRLKTKSGVLREAVLYPGGAKEWDLNQASTSHDPGVQPEDVERLLERGATLVILSTSFHERLGVTPETLRMLEEEGIATHVVQTEEAGRLYDELRGTEKVGALIHSTC